MNDPVKSKIDAIFSLERHVTRLQFQTALKVMLDDIQTRRISEYKVASHLVRRYIRLLAVILTTRVTIREKGRKVTIHPPLTPVRPIPVIRTGKQLIRKLKKNAKQSTHRRISGQSLSVSQNAERHLH